jgi:NADPH-dependent glutamate synthase beta subunit-like oxidoreductase
MRQFAVIGSGPAGFYTVEALAKAYGADAHIDLIDRLPVPYGLIRFGVAPDHQSIKAVSRRYDKVAEEEAVRFVGNVAVGRDVTIAELPNDRPLGIPGEDLPGVVGSAAFVGWYNGHPDFADLGPPLDGAAAAIIGNGNVALDVARILSKTRAEFAGSDIVDHALDALEGSAIRQITLVGRRGPHQIAMTPKELGELGHLEAAVPHAEPGDFPDADADGALDPGVRKSVAHLRDFATPHDGASDVVRPKHIEFDFFARPVRIEGEARAERLIVERTSLDADGNSIGTGETYAIPASLVVSCIGYRTPPIPGVPYDDRGGKFANDHGHIEGGLYCVGWARRGPSGTIGTNRPDGYEVADRIIAAAPPGSDGGKAGAPGLDALLASRQVRATSFADWRTIEGAPRSKMVRHDDWLKSLGE